MPEIVYTDAEAAGALISVIGQAPWEAVGLARAYLMLAEGQDPKAAADSLFLHGVCTRTKSPQRVDEIAAHGLIQGLKPRQRLGSAENPITKLFPAAVTEQRFLEILDELHVHRSSVNYSDNREASHSGVDFTLDEGDLELPINIKNAGTRFENAMSLVRLDPDDCLPIPAYKAHGALEHLPSLLYVISVDYNLVSVLDKTLPSILTRDEFIVWDLLNKYQGFRSRKGEDAFIYQTVRKYWSKLRPMIAGNPFHVISARKAVRILHTKPQRTPGIGLRAWGTGASAEVNVHVSIAEDTTPWHVVRERIISGGLGDVIAAVNRKRIEEVYDPEI